VILLADRNTQNGGRERRIDLFWGELSYLPPEHAVGILVVSAFPTESGSAPRWAAPREA
jgi:hypothetical protein